MKTGARILLIEDDANDVEIVMEQLKRAKFESHVKVITNGRLAINYLFDEKEECESLIAIFLDLKLPSISGIKILEKLRADDRLRHLHVIVMTNSSDPNDLKKCRDLGVTHYLPKPIMLTAFIKAVADSFHTRPVDIAL